MEENIVSYYKYKSSLGDIVIETEGNHILALKFVKGRTFDYSKETSSVAIKAVEWLDKYFNGEALDVEGLNFKLCGTDFQKEVWKILLQIPYGKVTTYGDIANQLKKKLGKENMSAQAVGGAVGSNPISIMVPCHRVIGKNGNLTGYFSGLENKIALLKIEKVDLSNMFYLDKAEKIYLK